MVLEVRGGDVGMEVGLFTGLLLWLSSPGNYAGMWETTTCFKSLAYMCEMTGGQNVKPTQPPGHPHSCVCLLGH